MYKYSRFNHYLIDSEKIIIYNFMNSKMLRVFKCKDEQLYLYLLKVYKEGVIDYVPKNELIESGVIVQSTTNELTVLEKAYQDSINNDVFHITILVNEKCNFKCVYCYEDNLGVEMSNDMIDGVVFFITDMIKKNNYHHLHIAWFGGEPLLSLPVINDIMNKIRRSLVGIKISSAMTTNGYLLCEATLSTLLSLGINTFQITLDGDADSHNKTRMLKNDIPTFDKIWENIVALCQRNEDFEILIRANYNETNYENVYKLIMMVKELNDDRIKMHFHPIIKFSESEINSRDFEYCDDYFSDIAITEYTRFCLKNNVLSDAWGMRAIAFCGNCYAANPNYFAIDPNGILRRCTISIKESYNEVGRILGANEYYIDNDRNNKWLINYATKSEQCNACEMLPLCYGPGCPEGVLKNGTKKCRKNTYFLDEILNELSLQPQP